jgi:hypothetical protein
VETEGELEGAGEASRQRFGGLGVGMPVDGDGVGNCFGAGGSLSGVCCCCCCGAMIYDAWFLDLASDPSVEELSFPVSSRWRC